MLAARLQIVTVTDPTRPVPGAPVRAAAIVVADPDNARNSNRVPALNAPFVTRSMATTIAFFRRPFWFSFSSLVCCCACRATRYRLGVPGFG